MAQGTGKTRSEVKAETSAALQSGDIGAPGESGKTLRELSPNKYEPRRLGKTSKRAKSSQAIR